MVTEISRCKILYLNIYQDIRRMERCGLLKYKFDNGRQYDQRILLPGNVIGDVDITLALPDNIYMLLVENNKEDLSENSPGT